MKFFKGLAGQTMIYGLGTIVPRLLNYLLLTPFYTRIFSEEQYGSVSELYAYSSLLLVLLIHGMETTYFRYSVNKDEEQSTYNHAVFSTSVFATLFLAFALIFKNGIAHVIEYENNVNYIVCFAFIIFFDVITSIPFARMRNQNRALKFSIIKLINVSVNILLNIFFFVICKDSENETLASFYNPDINIGYAFISNMVASTVTFLLVLPEYRSFRFDISPKKYLMMLNYTWPLIVIGIAGVINDVSDKIFIKYLSSNDLNALEQVGIYSGNYKLAVLMTIFIQMFNYAAEPFFFKKSVSTDAKESYRVVMDYFVIFCLLIFLMVTMYIDVFKYFIGSKFHVGLAIVPVILLANMFLGIYYNLSVWYKINNKTYCGAVISLIGVAITLILNILLIPKIGYLGSAIATIACYFVMVVVSYFWGRKVYPVGYNVGKILAYIVLAVIFLYIRKLFIFNNIITSLSVSTLFMLFYIGILYYFERKKIKKLLCM
ncbi:MAG: oligosaccharide flippase family protein [Salinivirgaceae bacterium]|nr:oligosaccharide flippase family protein [Salinivirgaceae bacterium]